MTIGRIHSWNDWVVSYEVECDGGWKAIIVGPMLSQKTAQQEYHRMKANEIVYPGRYRNIKLKQRTTSESWKDVAS